MPQMSTDYAPRVINPVPITQALIFSAAEEPQKAAKTLKRDMPWIKSTILSDPIEALHFRSKNPAVLICDDTALNLLNTPRIKRRNPDLLVALLSSMEMIHCSPPAASAEKFPYVDKADLIFAVNRKDCAPHRILTSVVRSADDLLNIKKYSQARRFIFLVVDDEPRWTTQFLPVLYDMIGKRAAVKVTRTYEETVQFLFGVKKENQIDPTNFRSSGHGDDVVCLISDIYFPRGKKMRSDAGTDLIRLTDHFYPRFPKIIASKADQADDLKSTAFLMPKGDPGSLQTLRDYIYDHTGMGDFLIHLRSGRETLRIKNIREMLEVVRQAEKSTKKAQELRGILAAHGDRDNFSTWLYMHGYKDLAAKLLPMRVRGRRLVSLLRRVFEEEIARVDSTPLVIDDREVFTLAELLSVLRDISPARIQNYSDQDVFSTWLDSKGYTELADEIRPIHGRGQRLENLLIEKMEKWMRIYRKRGKRSI